MIRKTIIVVLTLGAAVVAVGGALGSALEPPGGFYGRWTFGAQEYACLHLSISRLGIHYFTPDTPKASFVSRVWLGAEFTSGPVHNENREYVCTGYTLDMPSWLVTGLLGLYPAIAFLRGPLRRYRRRKRGLCVTCGYDLRGSPERCPECGMEIEKT